MKISEIYRTIKEECNKRDINIYKTEGYLSAKKMVEMIGSNDTESLTTGMNEASRASEQGGNATIDAMGSFVAYYEAYDKEGNR